MTDGSTQPNRPPMSEDVLAARRIYGRLQTDPSFSVAKARAAYREEFGVPYNHGSIDQAYMELIGGHFGSVRLFTWCSPDVAVPVRVALAFFLREMSGRKRKKSLALQIAEKRQMEEAQRLKKEYMTTRRPRLRAYDAEMAAARKVNQTFVFQGRKQTFLTVNQMLERFKNPDRYGLSGARGPER